jgi:hypothetical protein
MTANGGLLQDWWITQNAFGRPRHEAVCIRGSGGGARNITCKENHVNNPWRFELSTLYFENCVGLNIESNQADGAKGLRESFVHINGADCDWFVIRNNNSGGLARTPNGVLNTAPNARNFVVDGNI